MNRYDKMKESQVKDIDGENWPNPCSVNYSEVKLTKTPSSHRITEGDIEKFWLYMYRTYGVNEGDDILLNVNGVPYVGLLEPGNVIYEVDQTDLIGIGGEQ